MKFIAGIVAGSALLMLSGEAFGEIDESGPLYSYQIMNCAHPSLPTRRLEARFYSSNGLPCNAFYFKDGSVQLIGWAKLTPGICSSKIKKVERILVQRVGFTCSIIDEGINASFDDTTSAPEVSETVQSPIAVREGVPEWVLQTPPPWE